MDNPYAKMTEGNPYANMSEFATPEHYGMSHPEGIKQPNAGIIENILYGGIKGAGDIGQTALYPLDKSGITSYTPEQREALMNQFFAEQADPESLGFKGGSLGSQIAGTAGAGGLIAKGAKAVPYLARTVPKLISSIESGGFSIGGAPATNLAGKAANLGTRMAGGAVTGGAMSGMINPEDYKTGALLGAILPPAFQAASKAGSATKKGMESAAESLMYSSLKPTIAAHRSGDAKVAVDTLLDYGISPNDKGAIKLHDMLDEKAKQVSETIRNSNARINKNNVLGYLGDTRGTFMDQVDPMSDLETINRVASNFAAHPYFAPAEAEGEALRQILAQANLGKTQALQAAGKLQTMGAQQGNLAQGGVIPMAARQPNMQPYFNTSPLGRQATSPSAYPVSGMPRVPGRYTHNIDRVPEAGLGVDDALRAYEQRKADEEAAKQALSVWESVTKDTIPIQKAQALKQGTQGILRKKYGQQGSAEVEANKGLARGLREEIAKAEPSVAPLNAEEHKIIKTLGVMERRMLMDMNKNPAGLSLLAGNKAGFAAFLADRSAGFKSILARMLHRTAPATGLLNYQPGPILRSGLLAGSTE